MRKRGRKEKKRKSNNEICNAFCHWFRRRSRAGRARCGSRVTRSNGNRRVSINFWHPASAAAARTIVEEGGKWARRGEHPVWPQLLLLLLLLVLGAACAGTTRLSSQPWKHHATKRTKQQRFPFPAFPFAFPGISSIPSSSWHLLLPFGICSYSYSYSDSSTSAMKNQLFLKCARALRTWRLLLYFLSPFTVDALNGSLSLSHTPFIIYFSAFWFFLFFFPFLFPQNEFNCITKSLQLSDQQ